MMVVVSYDVNTQTAEGRKRLRHVAKRCINHGQRVQCSVFECQLDFHQFLQFREDLLSEIDLTVDSLRFYLLGNKYDTKIEHYGNKATYDAIADTLMF